MRVPRSKSWLNRFLILRSFAPDLRAEGWEPSDLDGSDVRHLNDALKAFARGEKSFSVGESGTGFRFLLARLSREKGEFTLRGSERLLSRPHAELIRALGHIGTQCERVSPSELRVIAKGWSEAGPLSLSIDGSESSQFASALLLAAIGYSQDFLLKLTGETRSRGYLEMTLLMLDQAGITVRADKQGFTVPAQSQIQVSSLPAEPDVSSIFTLAAVDQARGRGAHYEDVSTTTQPDRIFPSILKQMVQVDSHKLCGVNADLGDAPDLFPCLAALAALAEGESVFSGAPHLRAKESDRIRGLARLLTLVGVEHIEREDGMWIRGASADIQEQWRKRQELGIGIPFDPDQDHRLAFAAGVLIAGGAPIVVTERGVVAKSLPQFWSYLEGDVPRFAIIGHRGTGKSSAAKRWSEGRAAIERVDLDRQIEMETGRTVSQIFATQGEQAFREIEREIFQSFSERDALESPLVVLGAGFDPREIAPSWQAIRLSRATDRDGRIFVGEERPRLDQDQDPLTEFKERYQRREPGFLLRADRSFELAEGADEIRDPAEAAWVQDLFGEDSVSAMGGVVTIFEHGLVNRCERLLRWGVTRLEWRDDLIRSPLAWKYAGELPSDRMLVSFRDIKSLNATLGWMEAYAQSGLWVDWAEENGRCPEKLLDLVRERGLKLIISSHDVELPLEKLQAYPDVDCILKAARTTRSFNDLVKGHRWMEGDPTRRVFLPMSALGEQPRWQWYRAWLGLSAPLNFWREDVGSSLDQPTFSQWWRARRFQARGPFAAVLGNPVHHSRTPLEHDAFFAQMKMPVFAITMDRTEAETALGFLTELGLRAAAVTAPLKEAFPSISKTALNTLSRKGDTWIATSTDDIGFQALWKEVPPAREIVVWGGGGVLESLKSVLPAETHYYSASHAEPRQGSEPCAAPEVIIWASGSERGNWPVTWRPRFVIDLSYSENSIGRAVATEAKARYTSGLAMFKAQAAAQREFWKKVLA